jgi:hypothetical protein
LGRCSFYTSATITLFGLTLTNLDEGHEILMARAISDLQAEGYTLPEAVDPMWLTLGNVRTDIPTLTTARRVSLLPILKLLWNGFFCSKHDHPRHAMRCKGQQVPDAYAHMRRILRERFTEGCDPTRSWQERALSFGSGLHTLQDSYCIAHTTRIDNGDAYSALIDMHTWPSREHPFTTKKDAVWQDAAQTALRPDAAAAVMATAAALKIFIAQDVTSLDEFFAQYVAFREDIARQRHPEHQRSENGIST